MELLNATLGLSLLLLSLILVRDLRKQIASKEKNVRISLVLIGTGVIVFSIKELIKYGITEGGDNLLDESLETLYLFLTLGAFFSLLTLKELPIREIKKK